jgi:catechol 2,3-dioxygenase-like lactoylglutathione lyase family enzyme
MPLKCNGYMTLLFVRDIKRSRDFYENVLGLQFEHGNDDSASFILGPDALLLLNHAGADDLLSPAAVEHDTTPATAVVVTSVDDVEALRALQGPGRPRVGDSHGPGIAQPALDRRSGAPRASARQRPRRGPPRRSSPDRWA